MMLENERLVKKFANATKDSKVVFMTCSVSGGMEAAIINCLTPQDKALVINGGSFGERFVELLTLHKIPFTEIKLKYGRALKPEHLAEYESKGYTTFLMQKHETSTGVHYDINLVSDFCKRNNWWRLRVVQNWLSIFVISLLRIIFLLKLSVKALVMLSLRSIP